MVSGVALDTPWRASLPNGSSNREESFEPIALARALLRTIGTGALATLDVATGAPFVSLTTVATDLDGSPLILVSLLSAHTRNLEADGRASLLLSTIGKGDPLAHPRLTLSGRMEPTDEPRHRDRFLRRHPKAELYVDFPDFSFRRMSVGMRT
jgi:putative heme iron utilization protein